LERAVEPCALGEIRGAKADDAGGRDVELNLRQGIVGPDILQDLGKGAEFLVPIGDRPAGAVEMTDRVRGDLVAAAVERVDIIDASADVVRRSTEIDA